MTEVFSDLGVVMFIAGYRCGKLVKGLLNIWPWFIGLSSAFAKL